MPDPELVLAQLEDTIASLGLIVRGGFVPAAEDGTPPGAAAVVLIGNTGNDLWRAFGPHAGAGEHPLDRWTRRVVEPIAARFGARALFPFGAVPPWPFQRWAKRAEPVYSSPLGILIHPRFGLWHAYRAALVFDRSVELPTREAQASPCDSCSKRPCLSACPVGAFSDRGYDVQRCGAHLAGDLAEPCLEAACLARAACPVGSEHAYRPPLARFHTEALARSVNRR